MRDIPHCPRPLSICERRLRQELASNPTECLRGCLPPCDEWHFDSRLSYAAFPSYPSLLVLVVKPVAEGGSGGHAPPMGNIFVWGPIIIRRDSYEKGRFWGLAPHGDMPATGLLVVQCIFFGVKFWPPERSKRELERL